MKIAVIGSGVAGLSAAWMLSPHYDVTIFEKRDRLGGHSHTVETDNGHAIDTGFIVYNDWTYPNLIAFFKALNVPTAVSDMSFAISARCGDLEYAGDNLNTLFAQRKNIIKPSFWRMVLDIKRFYREAPQWRAQHPNSTTTLGELLSQGGYCDVFIHDHLIPMGAAIWSTPPDEMMKFPAVSFIRFCENHGLLKISDRPTWRTVRGGSREYINAIENDFKGTIKLNEGVTHILRGQDSITITTKANNDTNIYSFDRVIMAAHADQALSMLQNPTDDERTVLGAFQYSSNDTYLHTDTALMPRLKRTWSSWNYMTQPDDNGRDKVSVTYWMNRLQPINTRRNYFVSLNPAHPPADNAIVKKMVYQHPLFNDAAVSAQTKLHSIQGIKNTWFCGSYAGWGFHEDALSSALAVAEDVGRDQNIRRAWSITESSPAGLNSIKTDVS